MSQAQKMDYKREEEVQSSCSIWVLAWMLAGVQMNTGGSDAHV